MVTSRLSLVLVLLITLSATACNRANAPAADQTATATRAATLEDPLGAVAAELVNGKTHDGMVTGGQPTRAALDAASAAGITHVINLRTTGEPAPFDEAAAARTLGITYTALPIAGAAGLTRENVVLLDEALATNADGLTMLHCGSGNRVGALMALRAAWIQNTPIDEAILLGKAYGLTSLEPAVKELLARE